MIRAQILGGHNFEIPASIQLLTEAGQRICFNAGENVYLTRLDSSTFQGLPGLLLSLDSTGSNDGGSVASLVGQKKVVRLVGPPPLRELCESTWKTFACLNNLKVDVIEVGGSMSSSCSAGGIDFSFLSLDEDDIITGVRKKKARSSCVVSSSRSALWVLGKCPNIPGKMHPERAIALGVPKGPFLGQLKNGSDLTLSDGRVVKSSDVCDPIKEGRNFVVVDVAASDDIVRWLGVLDRLESSNDGDDRRMCSYFFHLTSPCVATRDIYKDKLLKRLNKVFGVEGEHIFVNRGMTEEIYWCPFPSSQRGLKRLKNKSFAVPNCLHDCYYLLAADDELQQQRSSSYSYALPLTRFSLAPTGCLTSSMMGTSLSSEASDDDDDDDRFCISDERELFKNNKEYDDDDDLPRLLFLGTGAALPSKQRNVSGIILELPLSRCAVMLDCGEGTLSQLRRASISFDEFKLTLKRIRIVFISHAHADHHLGIPSFLATRAFLFPDETPPLRYLQSELFVLPNHIHEQDSQPLLLTRDLEITTAKVEHIPSSFALRIKDDSLVLVYSGDTRPCDNLRDLACEADVLIHEATFEDHLHEEAVEKRHSTLGEAIQIGKDSNCKTLILTHFSQRRPRALPDQTAAHNAITTIFAKDLMRIKIMPAGLTATQNSSLVLPP